MGEQKVHLPESKEDLKSFIRSLLDDVRALEYMLQNNWFENDIRRIGAEQEMVLINLADHKPAMLGEIILDQMKDHAWLESELALFNLEITLTPQTFEADCLSRLEKETCDRLNMVRAQLEKHQSAPILTGILPTLRKFHLSLDNLTPKTRYKTLMHAINEQLLGSEYELRISGIDELMIKHDSPMLEACNTSFQVHLQVSSDEFVKMYNIAQTLAAPVMAVAANSPIVFGRRLWHESRIAMFQQSIDTRSSHKHMRERAPRVDFGNAWLENSILDIYKDDITRYRVLMSSDVSEDSLGMIENGEVPKLKALQVHNSTVYRWNRPCYGISDNGKPHLRIENRVLPAGPTVLDEVSNAAFWLGLMIGFAEKYSDITEHILFAEARDNFFKAARYGIDSTFSWINDTKKSAIPLVLEELLPIARAGLQSRNVDQNDIDKYLGVISSRVEKHMNGARWLLRGYTRLVKEASKDESLTALTASMLKNQIKETPIHEWPEPSIGALEDYEPMTLTVGECMTTDLFTVRKEDILELVGQMMDWRRLRYMPVEDDKARLVGLVSSRQILREFLKEASGEKSGMSVEDVMIKDPVTTTPQTNIKEAMATMKEIKVGALPVVNEQKELVGMITETDFLRITARLLESLEEQKRNG
ncbi:MAG: CBS domain-containing protein [Saprospiraceae bacterium]|nr:CBS domain-containing protein [Saprospiraceae bacterium]